MIRNLFSVFDPGRGGGVLNWIIFLTITLFFPFQLMARRCRRLEFVSKVYERITQEFRLLVGGSNAIILLSFIASFFCILRLNFIGLFPYIFTPSRHLACSIAIALPMWLGYISYGIIYNCRNLLAHLTPQGTPGYLIPLIVLIETVRSLIRPFTLSVRLVANIIAGHLLLTLISGIISSISYTGTGIIIVAQTLLITLESIVAIIQAYVLIILSVLYAGEVVY